MLNATGICGLSSCHVNRLCKLGLSGSVGFRLALSGRVPQRGGTGSSGARVASRSAGSSGQDSASTPARPTRDQSSASQRGRAGSGGQFECHGETKRVRSRKPRQTQADHLSSEITKQVYVASCGNLATYSTQMHYHCFDNSHSVGLCISQDARLVICDQMLVSKTDSKDLS